MEANKKKRYGEIPLPGNKLYVPEESIRIESGINMVIASRFSIIKFFIS